MHSRFVEQVLPNGLRVICEVMPRVRSASAAFLARTGARHETPPEHGVSHFLEHMCFKGTARRSSHEVNVRFDELGSIYNAYTSKEHTVYYGWVPAARLDEQIELLADLMRPSLPPAEFETERHVILEEIAMSDDNFDRRVWNFVHEVAFGHHPLAHEVLGEKETIQGLPHARLTDYHRRRYAPNNLCLIAAGAVEPEAVFAAAGRHCGDWSRASNGATASGSLPALSTGTHKLRLERFKQQSLVLLYPSVPRGDADAENVEAFTHLFGGHNSRCYWNIVQKGICTEAGALWVGYEDCGLLALFADGEPERCEEMLAALRGQVRELLTDGIRADEVQRVKNQRRTHLALEAENPRTRVMQLVDDLETHDRPRTADARLAAVEAVTVRSIQRYLERCPLDGDGLLLSCGPRGWP
ncbi:MAG: pitrilysin family protein [Planctomycetota bacterium]